MGYRVRYKGCVVGEQTFADEDTPDLRFGTKSGNVEELAICSCVEVNPSSQSLNAYWRSSEKKIPNSVGASTHPCLTLLPTENASDVVPLKLTMLCVYSWKKAMILSNLGGYPILLRISSSPLLLTKSNALVRSMKVM